MVLAVFEAAALELADLHERKADRGAFGIEIGEGGSVKVVGGKLPAEDQRAYCAALFEAVVGRAPSDSPRWPNTQPAWLGHVVLRGLSPLASEQWTSMREVAEALRDGMRTGRRRWVGLAIAFLAAAATLIVVSRSDSCDGSAVVTGRSDLDAWERDWVDESLAACRDARARSRVCLERIHRRFEILADASIDPDADRLDDAVASLPPPRACADPLLLAAEPMPPGSAALARRFASVTADLERARARASLGDIELAHDLATTALESARAMGRPQLVGRALWTVGVLETRLGRTDIGLATMQRAHETLSAAGHVRDAARVALSIAQVLASGDAPQAAQSWLTQAEHGLAAAGVTDYERELLAALRDL